MDNFLKLPSAEYAALPFPYFVHLARYVKTAVVLSTLEDAAWDAKEAHETIQVLQFIDQVISNTEAATYRAVGSEEYLGAASRILTALRAWCASKLAEGLESLDNFDVSDVWMGEMLTAFASEDIDSCSYSHW
ncbi:hypothetical protein LIA77_00036 [Sarocladium implicatum]|nr:hypothetical protein LIA77_00036 [Sarocladium implicatum]